jgi:hypothetical protein
MGFLSTKCAEPNCDHRFPRLFKKPDFCPGCGISTSGRVCPRCSRVLGSGDKWCSHCQQSLEPDSVNWFLPSGVLARRFPLTVNARDRRDFFLAAGVRAVVFVRGDAVTVSGPAEVRCHELVRPDPKVQKFKEAKLEEELLKREGSGPLRVEVFLIHDGPIRSRVDLASARTRDGIELGLCVELSLELADPVRFVGRYMKSGDELRTDGFEESIGEESEFDIRRAVEGVALESAALPRELSELHGVLEPSLRPRLEAAGLRLKSVHVVSCSAKVVEEIQNGRGELREHELELRNLEEAMRLARLKARTELEHGRDSLGIERERAQLVTDHERKSLENKSDGLDVLLKGRAIEVVAEESDEELAERRRRLIRVMRARFTDDQIHEQSEADRLQSFIRETEQKLRLDETIKTDEVRALESSLGNKAALKQLLDGLESRAIERKGERDRAKDEVEIAAIRADARRLQELRDAELRDKIEREENARDNADLREKQAVQMAAEDRAHARATESAKIENDFRERIAKLGLDPRSIALLMRDVNPALADAVLRGADAEQRLRERSADKSSGAIEPRDLIDFTKHAMTEMSKVAARASDARAEAKQKDLPRKEKD